MSKAIIVAAGVAADGNREVLGLAVGDSEDKAFWTGFLRSLRARGLGGVRLVAAAIRTIFAQPDTAAVAEQLDSIAEKLGRQFPAVEQMLLDAEADICAFTDRRYLPEGSMAKIYETDNDDDNTKEVGPRTNELLAG